MLEAAIEIAFTRYAELLGAGLVPVARGSENPAFAPDGAYAASDEPIFVTVHTEDAWRGLCDALDLPQYAADARFATNRVRVENREALNALLCPIFARKPAVWWLRVLARHGVACGIAYDFERLRYHQQVVENDMIATVHHPAWGDVAVGGLPWKFSATPCAVTAPSVPGSDTEAIRAWLAKQPEMAAGD